MTSAHNGTCPFATLPPSLKRDLDQYGLEVLEIIQTNPRKGRWTLKVRREMDGILLFLKWCHPETNSALQASFRHEQNYYCDFGRDGFAPKLIDCHPQAILLDYIDAVTLRELLLEQATSSKNQNDRECGDILKTLTDLLARGHATRSGTSDFSHAAAWLAKFWRNLLLSGPMGTSRPRIEELAAKGIVFLFGERVRKKIHDYLENSYRGRDAAYCKVMHGDLHCNNVLIDRAGGRVLFVDFENFETRAFWMLDLLYLWPMVMVLSSEKYEDQQRLITLLMEAESVQGWECEIFKKLCFFMRDAAIQNSRFSSNINPWKKPFLHLRSFFALLKFCV